MPAGGPGRAGVLGRRQRGRANRSRRSRSSPSRCWTSSAPQAETHIVQAQRRLQRVIETAPLASLFDARSPRRCRPTGRASTLFATPMAERATKRRAAVAQLVAGEAQRCWNSWFGAEATPAAQHREWRDATADRLRGTFAGDPGHGRRAGRRRPADAGSRSCCWWPATSPSSAPPSSANGCRRRSSSARCWCEGNHRIKNNLQGVVVLGCCSRTPSATPRWRCSRTEACWANWPSRRSTACRWGPGPAARGRCVRAIALGGAAHLRARHRCSRQRPPMQPLPEAEAIRSRSPSTSCSPTRSSMAGGAVRCRCGGGRDPAVTMVAQPGPPGAGLRRRARASGVSGLGLVRALPAGSVPR